MEKQYVISKISGASLVAITGTQKQQLPLENVHLWVNSLIGLSMWVSRASIIEIKLSLNRNHPERSQSVYRNTGGDSRNAETCGGFLFMGISALDTWRKEGWSRVFP